MGRSKVNVESVFNYCMKDNEREEGGQEREEILN
jgi:hypothetical protein